MLSESAGMSTSPVQRHGRTGVTTPGQTANQTYLVLCNTKGSNALRDPQRLQSSLRVTTRRPQGAASGSGIAVMRSSSRSLLKPQLCGCPNCFVVSIESAWQMSSVRAMFYKPLRGVRGRVQRRRMRPSMTRLIAMQLQPFAELHECEGVNMGSNKQT